VEAGWAGVGSPEAAGGAGGAFEDLILVFEEAGRAVVPLPLTSTLLAARAVARAPNASIRDDVLTRIVSGAASVTIALSTRPDVRSDGCTFADGRISGSTSLVPHGPNADLALVEAPLAGGGRSLVLVRTDAPGTSWTELALMDRSVRYYDVTFDNVDATSLFDGDASPVIDALLDEWTVALAAESLGAAQRMLEMTVAYAKERVQFGRPIGANQAVKWRIADMGAAVERMRAAVYHAAVKIDANADDRGVAVAMAKAATAAPGAFVGSQAIHVHGGVGFTWEHDLHLYFKRVKSNEILLGDSDAHLARIADAILA
jgi:alkylation response protein AidB-like acyl-CoA dehydrogenase